MVPAGRSLCQFFTDKVAKPLELDLYIGLPASVDRNRVAQLAAFSRSELVLHLNTMPPLFAAAMFNPFSLAARSMVVAKGVKGGTHAFNRDELRILEMPAVNGTGTARSIAKLYGSAATGDSQLGLSSGVRDALEGPAVPPTGGLRDKVMGLTSHIPWVSASRSTCLYSARQTRRLDGPEQVVPSDSPTRTLVSGSDM